MPTNDLEHRRIQEGVDAQLRYYAQRQPVRIRAGDTAYIRRHFAEMQSAIDLRAGESVCEWGAGMGRFSVKLLEHGCKLTAIELSKKLTQQCEQAIAPWPDARLMVGDILGCSAELEAEFDAVVGFFVLHHLEDLDTYFTAARKLLKPGGRMIFIEPNPVNFLYALQITFTPGMNWAEESGIYRLWPKNLKQAAQRCDFKHHDIFHYGSLPRAPYNYLSRWNMQRLPEWITPRFMRPFTVFSAGL